MPPGALPTTRALCDVLPFLQTHCCENVVRLPMHRCQLLSLLQNSRRWSASPSSAQRLPQHPSRWPTVPGCGLFLIKRTSRASAEIVPQNPGQTSAGSRGQEAAVETSADAGARTTQSALTFCAALRRPVLHLEAPGHDRQHPRIQHLTRYETHVLQQHPWSARTPLPDTLHTKIVQPNWRTTANPGPWQH